VYDLNNFINSAISPPNITTNIINKHIDMIYVKVLADTLLTLGGML